MDQHNYVMVPVPEQYVTRVMQHVIHLSMLDSLQEWDQDEVSELFAGLTEDRKAVLALCASAIDSGRSVTADAVAEKLQLPLSHIMKGIRDLAETARERSRPQLVRVRMTTSTTATGREVKRREVEVDADIAKMLLAAEQADIGAPGTGA